MRKPVILLWVGMVLPFALTILNGGPDGWLPHVFFHPAYVAFLAIGLIGVRLLRRATSARAIRRLALAIGIAAVLAMVGHMGEFIAVLRAGGIDANETVFEAPLHSFSATVTLPMVELAILLVIGTTIAVRIVEAGRPLGATVSRGIRTTHRWVSLAFIGTLPLLLIFRDAAIVSGLAIGALVVLLLTGLSMSSGHYLRRWRRRRTRRSASAASPIAGHHITDEVGDSQLSDTPALPVRQVSFTVEGHSHA